MGGKIQPSAVLVIQNGQTKLVNVKNQDGMTKILDMVPDIVSRFSKGKNDDLNLDDVKVDDKEDDNQDNIIYEKQIKRTSKRMSFKIQKIQK